MERGKGKGKGKGNRERGKGNSKTVKEKQNKKKKKKKEKYICTRKYALKKFGGSGGRVAGDFVQNHKILNFFWVTRTGSAFYKILEQKYFITIFFTFFM